MSRRFEYSKFIMGLSSSTLLVSIPPSSSFAVGFVTFGYVQDYLKLLIENNSLKDFTEVYNHFVDFCVSKFKKRDIFLDFTQFLDPVSCRTLEDLLNEVDSSEKLNEQVEKFNEPKSEKAYDFTGGDSSRELRAFENIKNYLLKYLKAKPEVERFSELSNFKNRISFLREFFKTDDFFHINNIGKNFTFLKKVYLAKKDDILLEKDVLLSEGVLLKDTLLLEEGVLLEEYQCPKQVQVLKFLVDPVSNKRRTDNGRYKYILNERDHIISCSDKLNYPSYSYQVDQALQDWILKTIKERNNLANNSENLKIGEVSVASAKKEESVKELVFLKKKDGATADDKNLKVDKASNIASKKEENVKKINFLIIIKNNDGKLSKEQNDKNFLNKKRLDEVSSSLEKVDTNLKESRTVSRLRNSTQSYDRSSKIILENDLDGKKKDLCKLYELGRENVFSSQKVETGFKYENNKFIPTLSVSHQ